MGNITKTRLRGCLSCCHTVGSNNFGIRVCKIGQQETRARSKHRAKPTLEADLKTVPPQELKCTVVADRRKVTRRGHSCRQKTAGKSRHGTVSSLNPETDTNHLAFTYGFLLQIQIILTIFGTELNIKHVKWQNDSNGKANNLNWIRVHVVFWVFCHPQSIKLADELMWGRDYKQDLAVRCVISNQRSRTGKYSKHGVITEPTCSSQH